MSEDEIMEYVENNTHPKALDLFELKTGDYFEELVLEAYKLHITTGNKLETIMANLVSRVK